MIDIGANLLHRQFADDRDAVLQTAYNEGVQGIVVTACNLTESRDAIALARGRSIEHPHLYCTAGVHPHDAKDTHPGWQEELETLAAQAEVVAIGETGLDFNRNYSPASVQRLVFAAQLEIAATLNKPVFVHDRESQGEVHGALQKFGGEPHQVVVHCFTGNQAELQGYLEAGFFIGITGWVSDKKRGSQLRELVKQIPLEQLLIETDSPFLRPHNAPVPVNEHTKRRNQPGFLRYVAATVAELYGCSIDIIKEQTLRNTIRFFALDAALFPEAKTEGSSFESF